MTDLFKIVKDFPVSIVQENTWIFKEGEKLEGVYFIKNGLIKISRKKKSKGHHILWYADELEIIGLSSYFQEKQICSYSARSVFQNTEVIFIPLEQFENLLIKHPKLKRKLIATVCNRISFLEDQFNNIAYKTMRQRLAYALLHLVSKSSIKNSQLAIKNIYNELTEFLDSNQRYVKKLLQEFQAENLVAFEDNKISITDATSLNKFVTK